MAIDYNYLIKTTPGFIRATVILILTGVVVIFAVAIAGAVYSGQRLQAWGLTIEEYKSPDAQKCASAAGAIQYANSFNQDGLQHINEQMNLNFKEAVTFTNQAAQINSAGGYSSVAEKYRDETKLLQKTNTDLLVKQNEIFAIRAQVVEVFKVACGTRGK